MADDWKYVDVALSARNGLPNQATMETLWMMAFDVWRNKFAQSFRPIGASAHACSKDVCAIERILVEYALQKPDRADVADGKSHGILHLCVRVIRDNRTVCADEGAMREIMYCSGQDIHRMPVPSGIIITKGMIDNLYVCASTGMLHACAPETCPYGENYSDMHGDTVCTLTGRILEERQMVNDFWKPYSTPSSSGDSFHGETERKTQWSGSGHGSPGSGRTADMDAMYVDGTMDIDSAKEQSRAMSRKRSIKRDPYVEYINIAVLHVSMLFSKKRYDIERIAVDNNLRLARREMMRYVTKNRNVDALTLITMQENFLRRRNMPRVLHLPDNVRKTFIQSYAQKCVAFWAILRTRTKCDGDDGVAMYPISDFSIAAMYIFKSGIYLPPSVTNGEGEQLLPPDLILAHCMPKQDDIENIGCNHKRVSEIERAITRCIISAVKDEHVNPSLLHPSSIDAKRLDGNIFKPLRKNKAIGKR